MDFSAMVTAVNDAKSTIRKADLVVKDMAEIVAGRLRSARVGSHALCSLKRELADYDMVRCRWKGRRRS